MPLKTNQVRPFLLVFPVVFCLTSCSSGPPPPQPGSPGYEWAAAKETYRQGDYSKTADHLTRITKSDNEFTTKAYTWLLIVTAGQAQGYADFADNQDAGGKVARVRSGAFFKRANVARNAGAAAAVQFVEAFHKFLAVNKDATLPLAFDFPAGSVAEPAAMEKAAKGMTLQDSEFDALQTALVKRGVLLTVSRVLGTGDDAAKALEIFKKGDVTAQRDTFLLSMANALYDESQMFSPSKLNQPNRIKMLSDEAMEALKVVPATKQSKELSTKIQNNLKKLKLT